jgi:hypothetical protein
VELDEDIDILKNIDYVISWAVSRTEFKLTMELQRKF